MKVVCPYCNSDAQLVDSAVVYGEGRSYGLIWDCRPCDAYVGTHKVKDRLNEPLGRLADKELRFWKIQAHYAFDPIWKEKHMPRSSAYAFLAAMMNLPIEKAHIGMFDVEQCKQVIQKVSEWKRKTKHEKSAVRGSDERPAVFIRR